jgi:hypothetical protein
MKGSKRERWVKDGVKTSCKMFKKKWNRKVRHTKSSYSNNTYKKLAGCSKWIYIP